MSQGFQKDFKRILQEFNPNLIRVSQYYFLRFSNSTFSMLLEEEEDEQEKNKNKNNNNNNNNNKNNNNNFQTHKRVTFKFRKCSRKSRASSGRRGVK